MVAADAAQSWVFPAIILPSQEVALSFRVSGQVIDLPGLAATQVAAGETVAQIDPRDFEAQVAQLESQRDQATAQLDALRTGARDEEVRAQEAAVASARAQADLAREEVERTRQLVERNVASQVTLDQAEAEFRVAQATLQAQEEQLTIARAGGREEDIAAAEAGLRGIEASLKAASDALSDTTLTAPFDGIIARRAIDEFSLVQAGQEIVQLQNISTLHLAFDVPGTEVPRIAAASNRETTVTVAGFPDEYSARLVEFATEAEAASQTYRGTVSMVPPENAAILPGMVGQVIIRSASDAAPVLRISLSAVGADPDGTAFVWRVGDDGVVEKQPVETGPVIGDSVEIRAGLAAGETVVAAGVSRLQEGMTVRPMADIGG
ncbi:MAG: efflux RND transporter periplasmic adaptor subunit [Pseudomonadota bacterium]